MTYYTHTKYTTIIRQYLEKPEGAYPIEEALNQYQVYELNKVIKKLKLYDSIRTFTVKGTPFIRRIGIGIIPSWFDLPEPRKRHVKPIAPPENYSVVGQEKEPSYMPIANPSGSMSEVANYYDTAWARLKRRQASY